MSTAAGITIATESIPFKPLAEGVAMRVVHVDHESGAWTIMIDAKKGSVLPRHRHLSPAEIYIIRGAGTHPQTGAYAPNDYIVEPKDALHEELLHEEDILLILHSSGPVAFLNDDDSTAFMMDAGMLTGFAAS